MTQKKLLFGCTRSLKDLVIPYSGVRKIVSLEMVVEKAWAIAT
jgi:hypothetical protein